MTMLEKMQAKLTRLEKEFDQLFESHPTDGHGGTPQITDNTKGRAMIRVCEKIEERRQAKKKQIDEQKEKIARMEDRIDARQEQTKKSKKNIEKNPIDERLIKLEAEGVLSQWARNPEFFFIKGLKKVALTTIAGRVGVSRRFPYKDEAEKNTANEILASIGAL